MAGTFDGTWHNQHESEMTLEVDATSGLVTGTYRTGVGSPSPSDTFPLTGFVAGDVVAFCVNFGAHGSLTAWAGQLTRDGDGNERIDTLWHLARNVPDAEEPAKLWGAVWSGCDVFRRSPPPTRRSAAGPRPSHPLRAPEPA